MVFLKYWGTLISLIFHWDKWKINGLGVPIFKHFRVIETLYECHSPKMHAYLWYLLHITAGILLPDFVSVKLDSSAVFAFSLIIGAQQTNTLNVGTPETVLL